MTQISYTQMIISISIIWAIIRAICCIKDKRFDLKREAALILVYICIVVVAWFTFCPFGRVNGQIQPLLFESQKIFPLWLNLKPFTYLFDDPTMREALLNLI